MWEYPIPQATNPFIHLENERHYKSEVCHSSTQWPRPWLEPRPLDLAFQGVLYVFVAYVQGTAGGITKSQGDAGHFE